MKKAGSGNPDPAFLLPVTRLWLPPIGLLTQTFAGCRLPGATAHRSADADVCRLPPASGYRPSVCCRRRLQATACFGLPPIGLLPQTFAGYRLLRATAHRSATADVCRLPPASGYRPSVCCRRRFRAIARFGLQPIGLLTQSFSGFRLLRATAHRSADADFCRLPPASGYRPSVC